MAKAKAKARITTKRRNSQDLTLRNLRVLKARVARLEQRIRQLELRG